MRKRNNYKRDIKHRNIKESIDYIDNILNKLLININYNNFNKYFQYNCFDNFPSFYFNKSNESIQIINTIDIQQNLVDSYSEKNPIDWNQINSCIDPASGELDILRTNRKRKQLESLIYEIEYELLRINRNNQVVIDFGSGSGHLGLLLAYRNRNIHVILVERKEYSVNIASNRIKECNLTNVTLFCDDIRNIDRIIDNNFTIGVSLHSCGYLTDLSINICVKYKSSFILSPCCYGQIAKPPNDCMNLLQNNSISYRGPLFTSTPMDILNVISSAADYAVGLQDDFTKNSGFLISKQCMRFIDFDRALKVCIDNPLDNESEGHYECIISSLYLTSSPKNNIIIGKYIRRSI